MNRIFKVMAVLGVIVIAVGMYRGWFVVSKSSPDAATHKVNINLAVDPDKMKEDAAAVEAETKKLTGQDKK